MVVVMGLIVRLAVFLLAVLGAGSPVSARKVALVIGNSDYQLAPLTNPANDARDVAASLKRLGFEVTERQNLGIRAFDDTVDAFVDKAKGADTAILFFSGHGIQIDKRGYLAPTDIKAESESSALRELVNIQDLISRIENSAKVALVILDACRDSPLQERLRRISIEKRKTLGVDKGLPAISVLGSNTLVVYATAPGEIAADGTGQRNSPFTSALLYHIETPGLEVELMFKRVTADVLKATNGNQQPERLSRLQSELILMEDLTDQSDWSAVVTKPTRQGVDDYVANHPRGKYVDVARTLGEQIDRQQALEAALKEEARRRAEADKREAKLKEMEAKLREEARQREEAAKRKADVEPRKAMPLAPDDDAQRKAEAAKAVTEELARVKEEANTAKNAAVEAEIRRKAAEKAAEEATKVAKATAERTTKETKPNEFGRPTNLGAYSLQYWPRNSFTYPGQKQSTYTPYGRLTCTSNGRNTPRSCSLN